MAYAVMGEGQICFGRLSSQHLLRLFALLIENIVW